jgi:hypothetical protein
MKAVEHLTWEDIVAIEPLVGVLYGEALALKDDGTKPVFCGNRIFHGVGGFKDRLQELVGWTAKISDLKTEHAYDIVYDKINAVIPPCRDCSCFDPSEL